MKISILMTACNPGPLLHTTVRSIRSTLRGHDYEIVMIDDCSDDGECYRLDKTVRLYRTSERVGCSGGRSLAAWHADGDILLICDPHCKFPRGSLVDVAKRAAKKDVIAQPPVHMIGSPKARGGVMTVDYKRGGLQIGRLPYDKVRQSPHPSLRGTVYAMNRNVYHGLRCLPVLPGYWGAWEPFFTVLTYRMGFAIEVVDTEMCTHMGYRKGRNKLPFDLPNQDRERNMHWYYASALPYSYKHVFKRMMDWKYGEIDMSAEFSSARFRSVAEWIEKDSVRDEHWFMKNVANIEDVRTDKRIQHNLVERGIV